MILKLFLISIAPVLIILAYIYSRDKYEKEPLWKLTKTLFSGFLLTVPILIAEISITKAGKSLNGYWFYFFESFMVAGLVEEGFKFLLFRLIVWNHKDFNERFDGIVYAVFISLGFALAENILYVFEYGIKTGFLRAATAVPFHALAGILMGYFFGISKFEKRNSKLNIFFAFFLPFLAHSIYDFCLFSKNVYFMLFWLVFLIVIWRTGFRLLRKSSAQTEFNPGNPD